MGIHTICVCGGGTMGSGIAQVAALAGFSTVLYDLSEDVLRGAEKKLRSDLEKAVSRGKLEPGDVAQTLGRMRFTTRSEDCLGEVIIEAILEKEAAKIGLFTRLAALNGPQAILASNTSSLSLTRIALALPHPERVIGLHFFNPAPLMKLVEVVTTVHTGDAVLQAAVAFAKKLNKVPVVCSDAPGFIVNRVARPYYIEALRLAEAGVPLQTIDRLLEARGFKLGPFRLMDLIGNDVNYAVSCSVWEQLGQPSRLLPSPLQKAKVDAGDLGKKTGRGYYNYEEGA